MLLDFAVEIIYTSSSVVWIMKIHSGQWHKTNSDTQRIIFAKPSTYHKSKVYRVPCRHNNSPGVITAVTPYLGFQVLKQTISPFRLLYIQLNLLRDHRISNALGIFFLVQTMGDRNKLKRISIFCIVFLAGNELFNSHALSDFTFKKHFKSKYIPNFCWMYFEVIFFIYWQLVKKCTGIIVLVKRDTTSRSMT